MSPEDPRHGSEAGYEQHRREGEDPRDVCFPCYEGKLLAARRRTKRKTMGYRYMFPADVVRARLGQWRDSGATYGEIADHVGIEEGVIWEIVNDGSPTVYARTAKRILSAKGWPVTTLGLTRRVRALAAMGWTMPNIAEACQVHHDTIVDVRRRQADFTSRKVRTGIVAGYDHLSVTFPNAGTKQEKAGITRARNHAIKQGWAPPLAWDDIDDPNERPGRPASEPERGKAGSVAPMLEDAEWLADSDLSLTAVVERLDVNRNTFRDACRRENRMDLYWRLANREPDADLRRSVSDGIRRSKGVA